MSDKLQSALKNLRWVVWGIAHDKGMSSKLFETVEFNPKPWTENHGVPGKEWDKYLRDSWGRQWACDGVKDRIRRWQIRRNNHIRAWRSKRYKEIVTRLKAEFDERVAYWTP